MDGITSLEFAALIKHCHAQVYKVLPGLSPGNASSRQATILPGWGKI